MDSGRRDKSIYTSQHNTGDCRGTYTIGKVKLILIAKGSLFNHTLNVSDN